MSSIDAPEAEDRAPLRVAGAVPTSRTQRSIEHAAALAFGAVLTLLTLVTLRDFAGMWRVAGIVSAAIVVPALAGYGFSEPVLGLRRTIALGILASAGGLLPIAGDLGDPTTAGLGGVWAKGLAGLVFALFCDLMMLGGIRARRMARARPWLGRLALGLAVFPLASFTAIVALDRGEEGLSRMEVATDLYGQLWECYPHWDRAPMKPRDLWAKYRPRIEAADSECGRDDRPCLPYLHALRDMFAELQNGHTEVLVPHETGGPAIEVASVQGRAVIRRVEPGSDAQTEGLEVGMEIVEVDGRTVEQALARIPRWRVAFTSAHTRTFAAYHALLEGPVDGVVRIGVASPSGPARTVALKRTPLRYEYEADGEEEKEEDGGELEIRRGAGDHDPTYVRLDGFDADGLEQRFDRAIDDEIDAPGLILDFRGNYGGILDHAFRALGRFFAEPLVIGKHCLPSPPGEETGECTVHRIAPRGKTYRGPIAVLINEDVYSAGELAAYALCRGGRARCFGRTTAGETDCVFRLDLPGAVARMSWADFRPAFGSQLLGTGLEPDVRVERTLDDVRAGRDPEFEAARRWLRREARSEPPRSPATRFPEVAAAPSPPSPVSRHPRRRRPGGRRRRVRSKARPAPHKLLVGPQPFGY